MTGDNEIGHSIDLKQRERDTKKSISFNGWCAAICGVSTFDTAVFTLQGLTNSNVAAQAGEGVFVGAAITLVGTIATAAFLKRRSNKKSELQEIRRQMAAYQREINNKGVEYGPDPERQVEDDSSFLQALYGEDSPEVSVKDGSETPSAADAVTLAMRKRS